VRKTIAVIPQNFLFDLRSRAKESLCGIPFGFYRNKTNGIPDKIAFPRQKAGKSDFSGMTNLFET
jgi:hypothetical protein